LDLRKCDGSFFNALHFMHFVLLSFTHDEQTDLRQ
jgi:hypothetical protein